MGDMKLLASYIFLFIYLFFEKIIGALEETFHTAHTLLYMYTYHQETLYNNSIKINTMYLN